MTKTDKKNTAAKVPAFHQKAKAALMEGDALSLKASEKYLLVLALCRDNGIAWDKVSSFIVSLFPEWPHKTVGTGDKERLEPVGYQKAIELGCKAAHVYNRFNNWRNKYSGFGEGEEIAVKKAAPAPKTPTKKANTAPATTPENDPAEDAIQGAAAQLAAKQADRETGGAFVYNKDHRDSYIRALATLPEVQNNPDAFTGIMMLAEALGVKLDIAETPAKKVANG